MRSAPQSRLLVAISLMKLITSGESLGFLERAWDLCFGEQAKELTMPAQKRLWLDEEKRLFPGPNHSGQEHEEKSVRLAVNWLLDLPMEDDELLSQERVFRDQFRFPLNKVRECAEHKGGCRWFDPTQETFLERVKAEANPLLDDDAQTERQLNFSPSLYTER
jgi:hypothetical protein